MHFLSRMSTAIEKPSRVPLDLSRIARYKDAPARLGEPG